MIIFRALFVKFVAKLLFEKTQAVRYRTAFFVVEICKYLILNAL